MPVRNYAEIMYPAELDWAAMRDIVARTSSASLRVKAGFHIAEVVVGLTLGEPEGGLAAAEYDAAITEEAIDQVPSFSSAEIEESIQDQKESVQPLTGISEVLLVLRILKTVKDVSPELVKAIIAMIKKKR